MFSKVYSHSNFNLLSEHLFFVAKVMEERALFDKELAFILGICHDFGKLTSFFQEEKILQKGKKYGAKSNHTLISIHFTIAFLKHFGITDEKLFLVAVFVINHHSDLRDMEELISSFSGGRTDEELTPQIDDLQNRLKSVKKVYQIELIELMQRYSVNQEIEEKLLTFNFEEFLSKESLKQSVKDLRKLRNKFAKNSNLYELFFRTSYLYSLLIFADRNMASKLPFAYENYHKESAIASNLIEKKVQSFNSNKDDIRQQLFDTLDKQVNNNSISDKSIFTVTAPTGAGKTLATLNFAFKLKEKYQKEKIIYALPLTNIIEQNYEEIKKILTSYMPNDFEKNEFDYLIKHHYLADYKLNEARDVKDVLKMVESWSSQIVVTTFIQLFYAFSSNQASYLYRFSALQNSILVLDEPQVLNPEHWLLIRKMLFWLVKHLKVIIILMTATKPLIFEKDEYIELAEAIDFKKFIDRRGSRHKLVPAFNNTQTVEEFVDFVSEKIEGKHSVLVVLNTKKSSTEFFQLIQEKQEEYTIYYLSTTLAPYHRKEVIAEIQKSIKTKKIMVVSTQVIEAGVDLDFEIGFRDLAPLDSIVQTAGRVNRHFLRKESVESLYVVSLKRESSKLLFGEYVYEKEYLSFTKALLDEEKEEADFEALTEIYFGKVKKYNQLKAQSVESIINHLDFQTLSTNFQIIEKNDYTIPVFLEINSDAKKYYQEYMRDKSKLQEIENYEERYNFSKEVAYKKRKLYDFIVNVNKNNVATDDSEWLTVVEDENLSFCYEFDNSNKIGSGIDEDDFARIGTFFG
ncbi:MAG TPA: CRISPR-associated helicase Cas3' [Campylobacterales bacterium]|nr:CRISPR-associated helicase Cas3' [Campylobacterales bacterium]